MRRRVGYNHLISNKREWNNYFIENAPKYRKKIKIEIDARVLTVFEEHGIRLIYHDD